MDRMPSGREELGGELSRMGGMAGWAGWAGAGEGPNAAVVLMSLPTQGGGGRRLSWTDPLVARSPGGGTWNAPLEACSDPLEASSDALERRFACWGSSDEPFEALTRAVKLLDGRQKASSETDQAWSGRFQASSAVCEASTAAFQA